MNVGELESTKYSPPINLVNTFLKLDNIYILLLIFSCLEDEVNTMYKSFTNQLKVDKQSRKKQIVLMNVSPV